MAVKSTFRSSNYTSESFQPTTFQFSLEKVCLALQKFHKAQTTNTPPTHRRRISYVIKLNSCQRVGRQSVDSRPTVDRLSTDCRPTRWPMRQWDRILNFYPNKTYPCATVRCNHKDLPRCAKEKLRPCKLIPCQKMPGLFHSNVHN